MTITLIETLMIYRDMIRHYGSGTANELLSNRLGVEHNALMVHIVCSVSDDGDFLDGIGQTMHIKEHVANNDAR